MMMEQGATSVRAICTHAVLSGDACERIQNSALTELIVSDTIPLNAEKASATQDQTAHRGRLFADVIQARTPATRASAAISSSHNTPAMNTVELIGTPRTNLGTKYAAQLRRSKASALRPLRRRDPHPFQRG
jgi:hypothetical protein